MSHHHREPPAEASDALMALRGPVRRIARRYGVRNVRVFGSFARGEQGKGSDIDLLVDLPGGMTLVELSGLKIDLEEAVQRRVDLVPSRSVKRALRDAILSEAQPL